MFADLRRSLRKRGMVGTFRAAFRAAPFGAKCKIAVRGKHGLEIGGPSQTFQRMVPVYSSVASLDNCVFSTETIWEGKREDGGPFNYFHGKPGRNRIVDAVELAGVTDGEYDFILSCHSLEHIANPIKALQNWRRVAPGYLILILPYYRETFDHRRSPTAIEHMIEDFERNIGEDDLTHLTEAITLSDLSRLTLADGLTLDRAKELANPLDNLRNRCLHHHVFDETNAIQLLSYVGYRVLSQRLAEGSIFLLAETV